MLGPPEPVPQIYFGGSSPAAGPVAARYADVYLTWGEPPAQVAEKIAWMRGAGRRTQGRDAAVRHPAARHHPRHGRGGLGRGRAAARPTSTPAEIAGRQQALASSRVGRPAPDARAARGLPGRRQPDGLEIHPNLWAGIGLVRGGAGTALVGSHEQVADRIEEYAALGIEEFILSGYPHLEEAYWFGEGVLPELRRRGAVRQAGAAAAAELSPVLAPA